MCVLMCASVYVCVCVCVCMCPCHARRQQNAHKVTPLCVSPSSPPSSLCVWAPLGSPPSVFKHLPRGSLRLTPHCETTSGFPQAGGTGFDTCVGPRTRPSTDLSISCSAGLIAASVIGFCGCCAGAGVAWPTLGCATWGNTAVPVGARKQLYWTDRLCPRRLEEM
jgi:hypothetical protein